ncbi:MAG: hypothetical protein WBP81_05885 [Solirubrobacteraceae bacterium]
MAVVHVHYFTDPCCPWSWALEPARFTYVMAGMAREEWKVASERLGSGELWMLT